MSQSPSDTHDDFQVEPVRGLPELPPEGEHILWQGAPNWWALARASLNLYWVAGYFLAIAIWRGVVIGDAQGLGLGLWAMVPYLTMGLVACLILMLMAWVFAVTTVYTITNRRVAMRIGAALTVTLNIPFTMIASADLAPRKDGSGTIVLDLMGSTRLSYLVCWPHVRPWKISRTQPALRAIPNVENVAKLLGEAAQTRIQEAAQEIRVAPSAMPAE